MGVAHIVDIYCCQWIDFLFWSASTGSLTIRHNQTLLLLEKGWQGNGVEPFSWGHRKQIVINAFIHEKDETPRQSQVHVDEAT